MSVRLGTSALLVAVAACSGGTVESAPAVAPVPAATAVVDAPAPAPVERWLKGTTHVHAAPSGDSTAPVAEVIHWYETHNYDFIVLTDHNRVTELDAATPGEPYLRAPPVGLLVLAGAELTYNPPTCEPPPPLPDGKCRIHVNALAVTRRPGGRIEWADRGSSRRVDMYQRAFETSSALGGVAQLNHPQWHWGMNPDLLIDLARRGLVLVEIANRQFDRWNAGDGTFPSMEALWDAALSAGVTLWGVATDDAHSYDAGGRYPAGGGWVMVWAARDPAAIRDALIAGRFYASTGVSLARAGAEGAELVVEVAADSPGDHVIQFIGDGHVLQEIRGRAARFPLVRAPGYVRAVVQRGDGARAWVQPARLAR